MLHLVVLPECLPGHAGEFQLGLCAVRGPYGVCVPNVRFQPCLRGAGRESHLGGTGLGLKVEANGSCVNEAVDCGTWEIRFE